jgi:hypothetical protein
MFDIYLLSVLVIMKTQCLFMLNILDLTYDAKCDVYAIIVTASICT